MKIRRFASLIALTSLACVSLPSVSKSPSNAMHVPVDVRFVQLLSKHVANENVLRSSYATAAVLLDEALKDPVASGPPLGFQGVNSEWTGSGVHLYVIDVPAVLADRDVCRPGDPTWALQCFKMEYFRNNCGVFSPNLIICDFSLVWRLIRESSMLALSAYRRPDAGAYYFPREELRLQFLSGEANYIGRSAKIRNIEEIAGFVGRLSKSGLDVSDFDEARNRVFGGFLEFLLTHEVGHLRLKHDVAHALTDCALPSEPGVDVRTVLCAATSPQEIAADDWAIEFMRREIRHDVFSPARAAPELFVEEHERRRWLTFQDLRLDPSAWKEEAAPQQEVKIFQQRLLIRIGTGSHPSDLRRYVGFMAMLEDAGVAIAASQPAIRSANEEITLVREVCDRSIDGGAK